MARYIDTVLEKLETLVAQGRFEELESDTIEIKPVPPSGGEWKERCKSVNSFLNTRGGILILGVKESGTGHNRKYEFSGWQPHAESKVKEFPKLFTSKAGEGINLTDAFPSFELKPFRTGQVCLVFVDELSADQKFVFFEGTAYKRILTGDHKITDSEVQSQEEYKEEVKTARELIPVEGATLQSIDLDKLNDYITQLNQPVKVETIKADLGMARPFLERKCFIKDDKVTTLGMLVCGQHPADHLGFRCHVHGYVDMPQSVAQDKQDFVNNILPLLEHSFAYVLRNIRVGISSTGGGSATPEYPEELIRETINNALAHRDYSINKQVIVAIKPNTHISIKNPGAFRPNLLVEGEEGGIPIRRILPEAKPRNPKLADVLRVYRKWEGRGIGMATLTNLCLSNKIDLPYYRFGTEEVTLYLRAGKLLDDHMDRLFESYDAYILKRTGGKALTLEQQLVLAYLIKSEQANQRYHYTVSLTPDNNHFDQILTLEKAGLITKHSARNPNYPVYVADRTLLRSDYLDELNTRFAGHMHLVNDFGKEILSVIYRFTNYSTQRAVSAKQVAYYMWYSSGEHPGDIKAFDSHYRQVRRRVIQLRDKGFLRKDGIRYLLAESIPQSSVEFNERE